MRYLLQYKGKAVASRGTAADALALRARKIREAHVAARKTKEQVTHYLWRIIDTQTGEEVK